MTNWRDGSKLFAASLRIKNRVGDRDTGSRYRYFFQTAGERLSLYFASNPAEYLTAIRVHVRGLRLGGDVALQFGQNLQPR